ncbi:hypothetical protein Tco_1069702 [Tanacetum coccineum]|uniref:Uncharacterized protein n=1 Tax=Tanacetum coccineum TaxID=301880 RepID=A0ABQ5HJM5_9ASTR
MEARLAPTQSTQVNKITTFKQNQYLVCEICSGSHDIPDIAWKTSNKSSLITHLAYRKAEDEEEVMFIDIIRDDDEPHDEGPNEGEGATTGEPVVEYFDTFPTRDELTYHSSIIDPRLSQVVLGRPFVEISNMTHDPPERVVRFFREADEVAYKMPHKIEQYDSFLDLEKEHTKLVYLRNEEDKRRGVEYVMNKIPGFYKECLELGPEYLTGVDDDGEVT